MAMPTKLMQLDEDSLKCGCKLLQDAINLRKWGKNDMLLAKRRLHQFAHAPMNWADVRRAVQERWAQILTRAYRWMMAYQQL